eukprot:643595-Amphidinium_carterae.1
MIAANDPRSWGNRSLQPAWTEPLALSPPINTGPVSAPPHTPRRVTFADAPSEIVDHVLVHYTSQYGGITNRINCTSL